MTHNAIATAPNRPLLDIPHTADLPLICPSCLDTLTPTGDCLNIGSCETADRTAAYGSRRETAKFRVAAWTIRGSVD